MVNAEFLVFLLWSNELSLDRFHILSYSRYSNGKPSLVFCGSKKDTETVASSLAKGADYARRMGSQARSCITSL